MVRRVVELEWSLTDAAEAAGVSERTCWKWVCRYRGEGEAGLLDRSSAPHTVPGRTSEDRVSAIAALRKLRLTGQDIALALGMPASTVSGILTRIGLGKLSRLEPPEPPNRYQRERPGELVHIDVKKLGRIVRPGHRVTGSRRDRRDQGKKGWEFVHVCIDDATRLAFVEVLEDEKAVTAVGFLRRAIAFYAARGITVQQLMTDNGSAYVSSVHALACRALGLKHLRTRPYRPRTNAQSRAIHPHTPRRLGLRRDLQHQPRAQRRTHSLDRLLQSPSTTRLTRPPTPGSSPRAAEQRSRVLQLVVCLANS
jgi:transposase InsO family protein